MTNEKGMTWQGHPSGNIRPSPSLMLELFSQACQRYPEEDKRDAFFETETSKERRYEVHHFSWLHTKMHKLFWQIHTNTYKLLWPAESHRRCLCQAMHVSVCVCVWLSHFSHVQLFTNLWTVGLETVGLLFPLDSPGKNPEVGCHALLQGIFPTQGSNHRLLCLPHCRQVLDCWATGEVLPGHHWPKYNSAKW